MKILSDLIKKQRICSALMEEILGKSYRTLGDVHCAAIQHIPGILSPGGILGRGKALALKFRLAFLNTPSSDVVILASIIKT